MEFSWRISRVKRAVESRLLARPGVTGVDIGYKLVGGRKTDIPAIRVYVEEKRDVPKQERIPAEIGGIKTDVIQRRFVLHPLRIAEEEIPSVPDRNVYDPLVGGISIGPCRAIDGYVVAGTLGIPVRDLVTRRPMLLTNYHVLAVDRSWRPGDMVTQPSRIDGGTCPDDQVGELARASLTSRVDAAVAYQTRRGSACAIAALGPLAAGTAAARVGMPVMKRGRTTEVTCGTVETNDLTLQVDYGDGAGVRTLRGQIGIEADLKRNAVFGAEGDSGALVVNGQMQAVGLYFAGSEDGVYGVANPIGTVLRTMRVSLCTGGFG